MGQIVVTGSSDGYLFVINAHPSSGFNVIGYTRMVNFELYCVSVYNQYIIEPNSGVACSKGALM